MARSILLPPFLLVLLLLTPFALASATPFYQGWVYPGDNLTVRGTLYTFAQPGSDAQLLLWANGTSYVLLYGDCGTSIDGLQEYCFTGSDAVACDRGTYDCGGGTTGCCPYDVAHVRYAGGKALFGSYVTFSDALPTVTLTASTDKTTAQPGDTVTITLSATDNGANALTGVTINALVPDGFTPALPAGSPFTLRGNALALTVNLDPNDTKTFTYLVRPSAYVTGAFLANLTYTYKGVTKTVLQSPLIVNVPSPFTVTHSFSQSPAPIDQPLSYNYTLKNNDGQHGLDASVRFLGLVYLNPSALPAGATTQGDLVSWKGTVAPGATVALGFPFRSRGSGSYAVTANASLSLNGHSFTDQATDQFTVTLTPLVPALDAPSTVYAGEGYTVRLVLNNSQGETAFSGIGATLSGAGEPRTFSLGSIPAGGGAVVADLILTAPMAEKQAALTLVFAGNYSDAARDRFPFEKRATVTVLPAGAAPYLVTHKASDASPSAGSQVDVTVKVKNLQSKQMTVTVTEATPPGIALNVTPTATLTLAPGAEQQAYSFKLPIPSQFRGNLTLLTQVKEQGTDRYTQTFVLPVAASAAPVAPEALANASGQLNETAPRESGVTKAVFSFFGGIVSFFTRLFS